MYCPGMSGIISKLGTSLNQYKCLATLRLYHSSRALNHCFFYEVVELPPIYYFHRQAGGDTPLNHEAYSHL